MNPTSTCMDIKELISYWKKNGIVRDEKIIQAFLSTPRHLFVPEEYKEEAYNDYPLPIGHGQTISQPTTVAIMTQALMPEKGDKVLEIGTGSGWQAAILARIVDPGIVYSVEIVPELVERARKNIARLGLKNVRIIHGDGSKGLREYAPFDRIIVTAASPRINDEWIKQLKNNGILIAPVGNMLSQKMLRVTKKNNKILVEDLGEFLFVPLRGEKGF